MSDAKRIGLSVLLLLTVTVGCGKKDKPAEQTCEVAPLKVQIQVVAPSVIVDKVILPCSVEAFDAVLISAEVAGRITKVTHEEGERVQAGEPLVCCDTEQLQADVDRAQAAFELAENTYRRIEGLAKSKYGQATEEQVDRARAERDVAKASLESAKIALDRAVIRSPLDGFLERRYVDAGEYVVPGTPVANVVRIDKLKVYVEVPERDVSFIEPGGQVLLHFGFNGEADFPGVIDNIDRVGDPITRTYRTRIIMENKDMRIRPGMIGHTVLVRGKPWEGISIPLDKIIARKGTLSVMVEVDGKAVEREVKQGVFDNQNAEIVKGLSVGDHLIVEGYRQVGHGDPVTVVEGVPEDHEPATVKVTEASHANQ